MSDSNCPFCGMPTTNVFYDGPLILGFWDTFPVSPGHALLVPKRHVATWFEASSEEQRELLSAIEKTRMIIEERYKPDAPPRQKQRKPPSPQKKPPLKNLRQNLR